MNGSGAAREIPRPPYEPLRTQLEAFAASLRAGGDERRAAELDGLVARWWDEQREWNGTFGDRLRLYHDINNALVGVRGNAQLLLMGPHADVPGLRDRLEVVIRESTRIQELAARLRALRIEFQGGELADGGRDVA